MSPQILQTRAAQITNLPANKTNGLQILHNPKEEDKMKFKILHLNIQCLSNKLNELTHFIHVNRYPDMVCLSEHWLCDEQIINYQINGYNLCASYCRKNAKHGGVLIYSKNQWKTKELTYIKQKTIETHFEVTGIEIGDSKRVVLVVYRPPGGDFNGFMDACEDVCETLQRKGKDIIICGDVNIDYRSNSIHRNDLVNLFAGYNLQMTVDGYTRKTQTTETCIDWIVTNVPLNTQTEIIKVHISDHYGQFFTLWETTDSQNCQVSSRTRAVTSDGIMTLKNRIMSINWENSTTYTDFHATFIHHFNECFPTRVKKDRKVKAYRQRWFDNELYQIRETLHFMEEAHKNNPQLHLGDECKLYKKFYKAKLSEKKKQHVFTRITQANNKEKETWRIINEETGRNRNNTIDTFLTPDELNSYFANIGAQLTNTISNPLDTPNTIIAPRTERTMLLSPLTMKK